METASQTIAKGGEFLIRETKPQEIFIPEEFSEEQRLMQATCEEFLVSEVDPNLDRIDALEEGLMRSLMEKSGELGLFGISIPEQYGGFEKDFNTSLLVTEALGGGHSFIVAFAAHTGIGILPILYFGNEEQKQKYLPKLVSGEWISSYCLTEPESGSDALAAKTKAELSAEGTHYVLNGQKMWITNAGFADVFIVFAQVEGSKFTGFIVEKNTPGLTLGNEEHKMGIKGSSTRQVFFTDCPVPKENVLGEIGKGHVIAFNILNIGRIKLGAACLGATKKVSSISIRYALERKQFGQPIAQFGAMQHKLAEQAVRIYALESTLYRTGELIHQKELQLHEGGASYGETLLGAAREFAVECAILKVEGSEALDYCVDEGVQIYGGYGFSADYPMDRAYRDARINRIFEGTNEINRMLIVDMILKKALKGELDFMRHAQAIQGELMAIPDFGAEEETPFAQELKAIRQMKKAVLMVAGAAVQKYMMALEKEQEILMCIADMTIQAYVSESVLLRVMKQHKNQSEAAETLQTDLARTYLHDSVERLHRAGRTAILAMSEGDDQRLMLLGLKRFTKTAGFNTVAARRRIAAALIEKGAYAF
jgi:alkylation response protein AidB-like acyl-CoA dehydrogenase